MVVERVTEDGITEGEITIGVTEGEIIEDGITEGAIIGITEGETIIGGEADVIVLYCIVFAARTEP